MGFASAHMTTEQAQNALGALGSLLSVCVAQDISPTSAHEMLRAEGWGPLASDDFILHSHTMAQLMLTSEDVSLEPEVFYPVLDDLILQANDMLANIIDGTQPPFDEFDALVVAHSDGAVADMIWIESDNSVFLGCRVTPLPHVTINDFAEYVEKFDKNLKPETSQADSLMPTVRFDNSGSLDIYAKLMMVPPREPGRVLALNIIHKLPLKRHRRAFGLFHRKDGPQ